MAVPTLGQERSYGPALLNQGFLSANAECSARPLFQGRGLLDHLNFTTLKDTQPDDLFVAWLALPDDRRKGMDAEFQNIFEMSCEKGFRAILDEAEWHI